MNVNDRLVWIDCEMTGLDIERDALIEIACLVTDADLTLLVGRLPGPGETVLSSAPGTVGFGGKGGNQAAAAAAPMPA